MTKKLSGWFRLFIVFAVMWTVGSITVFYFNFTWHKIEVIDIEEFEARVKAKRELVDLLDDLQGKNVGVDEEVNIEESYKLYLRENHNARMKVVYLFLLYWLAPIGFVYGTGWTTGWTTGWVIRGFRKERGNID
jgi:hypothetical protein